VSALCADFEPQARRYKSGRRRKIVFIKTLVLALFIAGVFPPLAHAATTIDPANRHAYAANAGWLDAYADGSHGAVIGQFVCSGNLYSANAGWINLGSGSPVNGIYYQNNSSSDFGVNRDGLGNLRGFAYGANIGWIKFEDTGAPKVNLASGIFSGYAWSANVGWISLSNTIAYVQTDSIQPGVDANGDGIPDAWELLYFATINIDTNADANGNGVSNLREYLNGANPLQPGDYLQAVASTIDAADKYAYGANIGWVDLRADATNGAVIGQFICSGYIYSANTGWIKLGSGFPTNGIYYQNLSASDFGVNQDGHGNLRGYAYGANIGWIHFEDTGAPKVDLATGNFSGYAWSANCGWISLSNAVAFVKSDTIQPGVDSNGDGIPDAWELQHFGTINVNTNADTDHDGKTTLQEYLAGTDPNNPGDYVQISPTTIAAANRYSYGANFGWTDWRGDTNHGAIIGSSYCQGFIYSANAGWIKLGNGAPINGVQYQNNSANDFGVNEDGSGNLRGFAWGANVGWINFENTGAPKVDLTTGKLSGCIWSANAGWISLSNAVAYVQTAVGPAAANATFNRAVNASLNISITNLLALYTSDARGDAVALVSAGGSTNQSIIALATNNTTGIAYIVLTPANNLNESFPYVVNDITFPTLTAGAMITVVVTNATSHATGYISISNGSVTMGFAGVPGSGYVVQRATDLSQGGNWKDLWTTNAPAGGVFNFTDSSPPQPAAFYRLRQN
jgi:hypothetical protein